MRPQHRHDDAATAAAAFAAPHFIASEVAFGDRRLADRNGFVTALGVRALRQRGLPVPATMLDALERCRSARGGFRFWPEGARPQWAPELPDDADDTAIMLVELLHAERVDPHQARRIACTVVARRRVAALPGLHPPWLRRGVFATWCREGARTDMVDCTATANVLALLATLNLSHLPGAHEATQMLEAALRWAGDDELRASSLSPFYPDPAELLFALTHATEAGAPGLARLRDFAAARSWGLGAHARSLREDYPLCSSPYGFAIWRSPELARLRAHAGEAGREHAAVSAAVRARPSRAGRDGLACR